MQVNEDRLPFSDHFRQLIQERVGQRDLVAVGQCVANDQEPLVESAYRSIDRALAHDDVVKVVIDPVAKGKPTAIKKSQIEERVKSKVSLMPQGLINKLSREEILDLVAYVFARGDKKHKLFKEHHH